MIHTDSEIWSDILGYEGLYKISSYGRVKSLQRYYCDGRFLKERILRARTDPSGYKDVALYKDQKSTSWKVHRLVCLAFLPNPDSLPVVNHIDRNKHNNHYLNLEWCTVKHNIRHSYASGNHRTNGLFGERCSSSKLTEQQVLEIRRLYIPRQPKAARIAFARRFNTSIGHIISIVNRRAWKHI